LNATLEASHFIAVPGLLSKQRAQALAEGLSRHQAVESASFDTQVPTAPAYYNYLPFIRLLVESIPTIETICEEKVLPTYAYARIYGQGDVLVRHRDREACELSITLNLESDAPWPIWMASPRGESKAISMEPVDAVMYLGCEADHWRDAFDGQRCSQVFMHYVFSYGRRAHFYFDKRVKRP
jgi:hypothetical protein